MIVPTWFCAVTLPDPGPPVLIHALLVSLAAVGCWRLVASGRWEARGNVEGARRLARNGGFLLAGATLGHLATGAWLLAGLDPRARGLLLDPRGASLLALVVGGFAALAAAWIGLLAGLSGKPRPSGMFAAGLFVLSLVALTGAWLLAGGASGLFAD
jgi:hypothetical protein